MPFTRKDQEVYRRDEKFGHKLLTPEERRKLIDVRGIALFSPNHFSPSC
jgi:hypothetical protein